MRLVESLLENSLSYPNRLFKSCEKNSEISAHIYMQYIRIIGSRYAMIMNEVRLNDYEGYIDKIADRVYLTLRNLNSRQLRIIRLSLKDEQEARILKMAVSLDLFGSLTRFEKWILPITFEANNEGNTKVEIITKKLVEVMGGEKAVHLLNEIDKKLPPLLIHHKAFTRVTKNNEGLALAYEKGVLENNFTDRNFRRYNQFVKGLTLRLKKGEFGVFTEADTINGTINIVRRVVDDMIVSKFLMKIEMTGREIPGYMDYNNAFHSATGQNLLNLECSENVTRIWEWMQSNKEKMALTPKLRQAIERILLRCSGAEHYLKKIWNTITNQGYTGYLQHLIDKLVEKNGSYVDFGVEIILFQLLPSYLCISPFLEYLFEGMSEEKIDQALIHQMRMYIGLKNKPHKYLVYLSTRAVPSNITNEIDPRVYKNFLEGFSFHFYGKGLDTIKDVNPEIQLKISLLAFRIVNNIPNEDVIVAMLNFLVKKKAIFITKESYHRMTTDPSYSKRILGQNLTSHSFRKYSRLKKDIEKMVCAEWSKYLKAEDMVDGTIDVVRRILDDTIVSKFLIEIDMTGEKVLPAFLDLKKRRQDWSQDVIDFDDPQQFKESWNDLRMSMGLIEKMVPGIKDAYKRILIKCPAASDYLKQSWEKLRARKDKGSLQFLMEALLQKEQSHIEFGAEMLFLELYPELKMIDFQLSHEFEKLHDEKKESLLIQQLRMSIALRDKPYEQLYKLFNRFLPDNLKKEISNEVYRIFLTGIAWRYHGKNMRAREKPEIKNRICSVLN